jgi:hypothetical protein
VSDPRPSTSAAPRSSARSPLSGYRYPAAWSNEAPAAATPAAVATATHPSCTGPTWTRKVDNKTVTRTLTSTQAQTLRPLLDNARRLRQLNTELENLGLQHVKNDPTQPDP